MEQQLRGCRVFLVEDEGLIALDVADMLEEAGLRVVATASTLPQALEQAVGIVADVALLDVNLARQLVWPAAEQLASRGIPLVFTTGFEKLAFPEAFATAPRLTKPVRPAALLAAIASAIENQ